MEKKKREKDNQFDQLMQQKNLISVNGQFIVNNGDQAKNSSLGYGIKMQDIPDFDKIAQEKENPLDSVVKKIEAKGMTVEQAFDLFDDDGDEVLTITEIKEGIKA